MRIEGKKNGRCSNGTIRRTNHKNIEAIGKGGVEKIEAKGLKGLLKKNFHLSITISVVRRKNTCTKTSSLRPTRISASSCSRPRKNSTSKK